MNSRHWKAWSAALFFIFGAAGCRDAGNDKKLAHARAQYAALVNDGRRREDAAFDAVRAELRAIPPSSKPGKEAAALLRALDTTHGAPPPAPLASKAPAPSRHDGPADVQRRRCQSLAESYGTTPEPKREALLNAMNECKKRLHVLEHQDNGAGH